MRGEELDSTCRDKRRVAMILIVEAYSASGIIDDITYHQRHSTYHSRL